MDKGTCPKDLRYVAKANIFPDEEFKSDIRALRKEAEQKFIGALTRFHYRRVERNQDKLRRAKSFSHYPIPPCALAEKLPETTVREKFRQVENASPIQTHFLLFQQYSLSLYVYTGES